MSMSKSRIEGLVCLFLYTGFTLVHVECCIRHFHLRVLQSYPIMSLAQHITNNHTDICPI